MEATGEKLVGGAFLPPSPSPSWKGLMKILITSCFSDEMGILSIELNIINLDDSNFDEDDPETVIHGTLIAWRNIFEQHKAFKKIQARK